MKVHVVCSIILYSSSALGFATTSCLVFQVTRFPLQKVQYLVVDLQFIGDSSTKDAISCGGTLVYRIFDVAFEILPELEPFH